MPARRPPESPAARARKAEWAEGQAKKLRDQAFKLETQSSGGKSIRAARKYDAIDHLNAEAARFEAIAARFRAPPGASQRGY